MNKQTNTPELRFPEFDEEWEKRKLGEVVNYKNGGSFESLVKNHGVYKLITLKSVNTEGKLCNSGKYIDDKCVETLCNDTLVMILSEQAPGLVGMTAIIPNNNEYVLNQRVAALVPKQFIDSQFLSKLINRNQKYFSVRSAGTKVKNISKGHVENFNFLSPDYTEQQKIGNFFSKLDRQIELEEEKLELLEQQKRGYMQKIFSQELRFKDENNNNYPEWKIKKLEEISEFQNGKAHENFVSDTGKFILVNSKFISTESKVKKYVDKQLTPLRINDIAIVMSDVPNGKALAKCYLIENDNTFTLNQRIGRIFNIEGNSRFLFTQINRNKQLLKYDSGVGQTNLKKSEIIGIKIYWPNKREQDKIGDFFINLDSIIEKQSTKVELLKQRKKGLLQKMFV